MGEQQAPRRASHFHAIALDYDGTLTEAGRPDDSVLAALQRVRSQGLRVVLVTGRILDELRAVFDDVGDHVDCIVAENGAVLETESRCRDLAAPVPFDLLHAITARHVAARHGRVLIACAAADEHVVVEEVNRLGLEVQLVVNRSELMLLPSGVNKGTGLLAALAELGLSRHDAVGVGDAENDHSLLELCEVGIAVANSVGSLRAAADVVLDERDGAGVVALLDGDLLAGRVRLQPARWSVTVGVDDLGAPVRLPAAQVNVLIAGASGRGKSFVAGSIAEQLVALGYSVLVVDPEGDHIGLGRLPGVLVVGGERHLPPPAALVPLLRLRDATVVVDLSHLDAASQAAYLRDLPAEIEAQRRACGLPHWVFIDEAHGSIGRHGTALGVFDPSMKGHCLITWRPGDLAAEALASVDVVLALTDDVPDADLVEIAAAVADLPRAEVASAVAQAPGRVVVAARDAPRAVRVVTPAERVTPHLRHEHKYARTGMPLPVRFYFRDEADRPTGVTAAHLGELETVLASCDRSVLRHHCPRHDLSRWVADVFHDLHLADALRAAEDRIDVTTPAAVVEAARLDLVAALQSRQYR